MADRKVPRKVDDEMVEEPKGILSPKDGSEKEMKQEELFDEQPLEEKTVDDAITANGKITLGALQIITPTLNKVFNASLPIAVAYKVSKALGVLNKELKEIEDHRIALVKKHGTEDGDRMSVPAENMEAFAKDFQELMDVVIEDFSPVPISFEALEKSNLELSPIEVNNLVRLGFLDPPA